MRRSACSVFVRRFSAVVLVVSLGLTGCSPDKTASKDRSSGDYEGEVLSGGDGSSVTDEENREVIKRLVEAPYPVASTIPQPEGSTFDDDLLADPLRGLELPDVPSDLVDRDTFEAPATLDELKAGFEWEDGRIADGVAVIEETARTEPPIPMDEAIGLENDSAKANAKLLKAFGQYPQDESEVDYDARFVMHFSADAKTTNPILISSKYDQDLLGLTGIGLIGTDYQMQPYAPKDVVAEWKQSKDRLVDLFVLRDDLTWSDHPVYGSDVPVTAYDVEFSFDTIMDEEIPVYAVRSGTDELVDVVAYDDRTVAIFHESSKATNINNAGFPILPKHVYAKTIPDDKSLVNSEAHIDLEEKPVVAGPYEIIQRSTGQRTVLARREAFYMHDGEQVRAKPHFAEVQCEIISDLNTALLAMKNGKLDYLELTPQQWDSQTSGDDFYNNCTKLSGEGWAYSCAMFNTTSPIFKDRNVRRAISYAFDHAEFLDTVTYGLYRPGQGPFHPDSWYAPDPKPQALEQDFDIAEELLDESGWLDTDGDGIRDKDGKKMSITVLYGTGSQTSEAVAKLLAVSLDQVGIEVNPKSTEFTTMQDRARKAEFDMMVMGWGTGSDPDSAKNLWTTRAIETEGRNFARFRNEAVDTLFVRGIYEFDREKRGRLYGRISELLWHEQPYIFLGYRPELVSLSNTMRGVQFSPRGMIGYGGGFEGLWKPKK